MKNVSLIVLCILGILFQYGCTQPEPQKESQLNFELNTVLNKRSNPADPGFVVLAAHKGKVVYTNAFGASDPETKTPLTTDMIFNAGYLTRQITATAIMQLAEQGKLSVKDPVSKFVPDCPTEWSAITIEHLLTETSGIKDYSQITTVTEALGKAEVTPLELIGLIAKEALNFSPGTAFESSKSGALILGFIIANVSGVTYEQYIQKNIFETAGMQNSTVDAPGETSVKLAKAYKKSAAGYELASPFAAAENAASGLYLNLDDYLKFYEALNAGKLINQTSLEQSRTPFKLTNDSEIPYGYGTELTKFEGKPVYNLMGYDKGSYISQFYLPYQNIQVLVLSNCDLENTKYLAINIYLKVITDLNTSLAFTDGNNMRIEYYHFLFHDVVMPKGGIIPEGEKTSVFVNGLYPTVHYTTDGTEPTIDSPVYTDKIEISQACTLKIKNFHNSETENKEAASYIFKTGKALEPIADTGDLKPGIKYSYYHGNFNSIPDFDKLTPAASAITDVPDLSIAMNTDTFAVRFDGYLKIENDGLYNLYTISDDGSQLYLNDELIVDSDGSHGNIPSAYVVPLKKGYYALKILYFEKAGHEILQAGFWTEGSEPKPFAKEMLFHKE
jgi:CubicO group peptidase (beta-lactamase class C family)